MRQKQKEKKKKAGRLHDNLVAEGGSKVLVRQDDAVADDNLTGNLDVLTKDRDNVVAHTLNLERNVFGQLVAALDAGPLAHDRVPSDDAIEDACVFLRGKKERES